MAWVAALIAVLIVAGYALWRGNIGGDGETRAQLAAGTTPPPELAAVPRAPVSAPVPPAVATPARAAGPPSGPVVLTALAPVWLRIYERDGKTLYVGELAERPRYQVPPGAVDPLIRTGRPEFLRVTVGSTVAASLGPAAAIIRDVSLKPDTLGATRSSAAPSARSRQARSAEVAEPVRSSSSGPVIPALPPSGSLPLARP